MATMTTTYGSTVNGVFRAYTSGSYTISDTQYVFSITGGLNIPTSGYKTTRAFTSTVYVGSTSLGSDFIAAATRTGVNTTAIKTVSYTVTRTHSAQTITFKSILKGSSESTTSTATLASVTVPAKSSWTVSYNANSGSGAPGNQTKWYGETLTLSSSVPTRTNYTFLGWATSQTNANNGVVAYQKGGSYTANSGITLYAVWKQNYILPTITNLSAIRCNSSGSALDTGTYIKLSFTYLGGSLNGGDSRITPTCNITISGATGTPASPAMSDSTTATPVSMIYGNGTNGVTSEFNVNNSYTITVKLYDQNNTTGITKTATVGAATFPIDILGNGSAMGLMAAASEESGHVVTIGGNTYINGDLTINNNQLSDFVIEQNSATGTDNSAWYYRKWKSGRVEAWGKVSKASTAGTAWTSPIYYYDMSVNIPSGIFTAAPIRGYVTGNIQWITGGINFDTITTTSVSVRLIKPASSSQAVSCCIYLCSF